MDARDYLLRCTLLDTKRAVCRWVRVPGLFGLASLHLVLQVVMQWEDRHLHVFEVDGVRYGDPEECRDERVPLEELLVDRPEFHYRYDFGDGWRLELEVVMTFSTSRLYPTLVAGQGPAPPEDCGGVPGFERLLGLLEHPERTDPQDLRRWVGPGYDPRRCPVEAIRQTLVQVFAPAALGLRPLGEFDARGLNVKQAMVAALLEAGRPMELAELARRLEQAGVRLNEGELSLKKAWRKQKPLIMTAGGLDVDRDCPEYLKLRRAMRPHRALKRFLVQRFALRSATVAGEPIDVVLVVEEPGGFVAASRAGSRSDGMELVLAGVDEALERRGRPEGLVVAESRWVGPLASHTGLEVQSRAYLPELEEPYQALEAAMAGSGLSFAGIQKALLAEFVHIAVGFCLEAPWLVFDDHQMLLVEGLTPEALLASVLGGAGQTFGLGLFDDPAVAAAVLAGSQHVRPMAFLSYLDAYQSYSLREELRELGSAVPDDDLVPFCFDAKGPAGPRAYRLMTDVMQAVLRLVAEGDPVPPQLTFELGGREVRVSWPIDPALLASRGHPTKVGRNDPCWCGSGKKYKLCHLGRD